MRPPDGTSPTAVEPSVADQISRASLVEWDQRQASAIGLLRRQLEMLWEKVEQTNREHVELWQVIYRVQCAVRRSQGGRVDQTSFVDLSAAGVVLQVQAGPEAPIG